jgi:hypothetical protein
MPHLWIKHDGLFYWKQLLRSYRLTIIKIAAVLFNRMVVVQLCQEMVETLKLCGPGIVAERKSL